jgi:hypothetical protein
MTSAFSARRTSGGWRIERAAPGEAITDPEVARATAHGNRHIGERLRDVALDEAWKLELEKATFTFGRAELVLADEFAMRCKAAPERVHTITGPVGRWALMQALAAAGEPVAGRGAARLGQRLRFLAASAVGLLTWTLALARDPGGGNIPVGARDLAAVHPETTNRTGHLFKALAAEAPETPVLLLGRPFGSRAAASALLAEKGLRPGGVARPYGVGSALATFRAWLGSLGGGTAMAAAAPVHVPFRELAAQSFRRAMGLASAHWWTRSGLTPGTVVFGHCGLADTAPLERAMQARGTRTAHWLHGLSAGWIYNGVSDLLFAQCGHDAGWHGCIGPGYRRTTALTLPVPARIDGEGDEMVVLTNFAHPAHPSWAAHGPRDELALIEIMAEVARRLDMSPDKVIWRPHPVLYAMPAGVRDALKLALSRAGFRLWPAEDRDFAAVARYGVVVSTPGGSAIDVLKLGRMPVIAAPHPIDPDHVMAGFDRVGSDAETIVAAIREPVGDDLFEARWRLMIAPGAVPTYARVVEELKRE